MKSRHLIEPEAVSFIENAAPLRLSREALPGLRAAAKDAWGGRRRQPAPGVIVQRASAPGVDGGPDVPLILYRPEKSDGPSAALLLIHGGGFVVGDAEGEADWCEWLVSELRCVVVAPKYRLAPESPFPAAVMDCYAALVWLYGETRALGVDVRRLGVWGGSAGGGLAAALTLLARDRGDVSLRFQVLLYPMLDDRTCVESEPNEFAGEFVWTRADNAFGWECLLGRKAGGADVSPYAAASRAADVAGLPAAFIWVGALDLFVDESIEYARRLIRAGVSTELHVYPGVTHGNILDWELPSSRECRGAALRALRRAIGDAM